MTRPTINGARGVALLGFAVLSLALGVAYAGGILLGPFSIWPPVPPGTTLLASLLGLHFWGAVWLLVGMFLLVGAYRQDQSKAMAAFAGICGVWGSSYGWGFAIQLMDTGRSGLWVAAVVYFAMLVASLGISRMLNAPPLKVEQISRVLQAAQDRLDSDGDEGHG